VKKLLIVSLVALVAVGGLALYSLKLIGDFGRRDKELREAFAARGEELLGTDRLFPAEPRPHLDPARFQPWLEARGEIARVIATRAAERGNAFHDRETRNQVLALLKEELVERKMGLSEYRATAARWRALLARTEFEALREAWRTATATKSHPEGLPLPPPAGDAQEKEIELIRRYARLLEESMDADLLDPTLDGIGG
jgi:hypothetical protein